jgi:hypothetical protein
MKPGLKPAVALLVILGLGDLVQVPFMLAAHRQHAGEPPAPAIVAVAIIGLVTLACAAGLAAGRRWAIPVAVTCRVLDAVSALLGLANRPSTALVAGSAVILVLSVVAIVLLVRLSPRRNPPRRAAPAAPSDARR